MKTKLTQAQIEDIVETLCYNIQFYNAHGESANDSVGLRIREVLLRYSSPKRSKRLRTRNEY
jgi:hypothetical protein